MLNERENLRSQLSTLLAETPEEAASRAAAAYDSAAGRRPIVLFGAGGIGRKTAAALEHLGNGPIAFSDNNPSLWGTRVAGVPVCPPAEAAERFGEEAAFVVSIWRGEGRDKMGDHVHQLRSLGCNCVVPFGLLYWKYADSLLPHYALDLPQRLLLHRDAVIRAYDVLSDDASRREYVGQVRWRLHLDFDGLADPVAHATYFPDDVCQYRSEEVFVDCGAFIGDTLEHYFARPRSDQFKAIAIEPDPGSFDRLSHFLASAPAGVRERVRTHRMGLGAQECCAYLDATGLPSAALSTQGTPIQIETLDRLLAGDHITYLKMDIEGAEPEALQGGRQVIARDRPVLAICAYHRQDHLWSIANLIAGMVDDYEFYLRPHLLEVWDLVLYAIPSSRRVGT